MESLFSSKILSSNTRTLLLTQRRWGHRDFDGHTVHGLGKRTGGFTVSLSAGNWVHPREDSRRCELALTDGWTAGQAVPEDCGPCSELGVGRCSGQGGSGMQRQPLPVGPECRLQRASSLAFAELRKYDQVLL